MEADALAHKSEEVKDGEILIIDPSNPLRPKKAECGVRMELLRRS